MANTLRFKRGLAAGLPASVAGEPLFTTDTFDLYIGNGTTNTRFQKYIASGTTLQYLRGDGSLATFPTDIVTGTGVSGQVAYWSGTNTQVGSANLVWDNANGRLGIMTGTPTFTVDVIGTMRVSQASTFSTSVTSPYFLATGTLAAHQTNAGVFQYFSNGVSIRAYGATAGTGFIRFLTGGGGGSSDSETMRLDASGNLGLSVTPSAWASGYKAFQVLNLSLFGTSSLDLNLSSNVYYDGTTYKYIANGFATLYNQYLGKHYWSTAASGTAGGTISFTQPMTLTANGRLLLGSTSEGTQILQVTGDTLMKGSGNTSATTAFTVQDSAGNNILRLRNDLAALFNFVGTSLTMSGEANYTIMSANQAFYFRSNGGTAGRAFKIFDNATSLTGTTGANQNIQSLITFAPTSGTATYTDLDLFSTINQTGGANGITRGLYVRPTLTAAADWRSIETSNNSGWSFYGAGTANSYFGGSVGIGTTSLTGINLSVSKTITGATSSYGILNNGVIQPDVTSIAAYNRVVMSKAAGAATSIVVGYWALQGAYSGTVDTQYGYLVDSTLTGATNNYAFFSNIASGTGRWNLYMNGTAANYFAGNVGIGNATPSRPLVVNGDTTLGGNNYIGLTKIIQWEGGAYWALRTTSSGNQFEIFRGDTITTPFGISSSNNTLVGSVASDSGEKLQVNGTMKVTGASTFGSSVTITGNIVGDGTTNTYYQISQGNYNHRFFTRTNVGAALERFTIEGGAVSGKAYFQNTDVGIGTTSPTTKLDVSGTFNATGAATFSSTLTTGGNILIGVTAGSIGAMNFIKTGTSPVASRLTFGTDGTGYSFAIGKNQAGTVTDLFSILDSGAATFSSSVTAASATITGNLAVDSTTLFVDATANEVGIGTNAPNSVLQVVGSVSKSISDVKTANYTATATDHTILCSAASGGFTITLPAASGITGRIYVIKKTNASSGVNSVTVDGNGSETIDGSASINLACKSSVMLQCDGSNWHILSLYSDSSCL